MLQRKNSLSDKETEQAINLIREVKCFRPYGTQKKNNLL